MKWSLDNDCDFVQVDEGGVVRGGGEKDHDDMICDNGNKWARF